MASAKGQDANVAVRPATEADLPAIKQMVHEFVDYLNAIDDTDALNPALADKISELAFGSKPICSIEIAEIAGTQVGYMIYFFGMEMDGYAPALYIAELFVREAWRIRGAGRVLMERAASITRERGGSTLFWAVWNKNPKALSFYRQLGALSWDEAILMRWDVGEESPPGQ
jgi:GNAT superfamily N-acetyltransferase